MAIQPGIAGTSVIKRMYQNDNENLRSRLYWQCRRGMLELDCLLQDFLESGYETLSIAELQAFQDLLSYPDPLLLEYVMGRMQPSDRAIADVVAKIRCTVTD
jgi:antitoxin CptB